MAACNVSLSSPPVENENLKRARKKLVLAVELFCCERAETTSFLRRRKVERKMEV